MHTSHRLTILPGRFVFALLAPPFIAIATAASAQEQPAADSDKATAQQVIEDWPETSNKVAGKMIEKYGEPDGVTESMLIWQDNGPWIRTIVHKEEIEHNFPVPHKDVLEQFIAYEVPEEKFSELAKYDGSVVAYRTNGEISARCDKEGANFLALNLANDIIEGERSVEDARAFYAQTMQKVMQGEKPEYVQGLQFRVRTASATADPGEQFDPKASEQVAASGQATQTESSRRTVASMSAAELSGKDVVSADGEVIGEVTDVSDSEEQGQRTARVKLSGFLGIGTREIELPLSQLSMTAEGDLQTTMSDEELKALPEAGQEIME